MEESDQQYRDAFDHADGGMALLAADGTWRAANPALGRLLDRPLDTLVGTRAHDAIFATQAAARITAAASAARARDVFEADDGAEPPRRWRVSLSPLAGAPATVLLQLEDVGTARRQQDLLAYGISHDLRAPLRSISGFAARLAESTTDAGAAADVARIRAAVGRAEHLIDDLLELSRAGSQAYRDDVVDLSFLGEWVGAELRDAEPSREATIDVPPGLYARGDEHWLRRLLQKLFGNAWKFSSARPRVDIAMDGAVSDGVLALTIRDQGSGFDMRYAGKLFQPFQRLHGSEQGGGNGLGLAISRQIVARHGGRIWARSQPGEGSTFFVELPAAAGTTP